MNGRAQSMLLVSCRRSTGTASPPGNTGQRERGSVQSVVGRSIDVHGAAMSAARIPADRPRSMASVVTRLRAHSGLYTHCGRLNHPAQTTQRAGQPTRRSTPGTQR